MSRDILGDEEARKLREVQPARRGYEWGEYVTVLDDAEAGTQDGGITGGEGEKENGDRMKRGICCFKG